MIKKTAIVFVQLGNYRSDTLFFYAKFVKELNSSVELYLITDKSDDWIDFPGTVLKFSGSLRKHLAFRNKILFYDKFTVAGGYWANTLLRIFALAEIEKFIDDETQIIHIESDVIFFPYEKLLSALQNLESGIYAVEMSKSSGIAAIIYASNKHALVDKLNTLSSDLRKSKVWKSDMQLIGEGIANGVIKKLPTIFMNEELKVEDALFVFDGVQIGQFLFGRDPILNKGIIQGGYQHPDSSLDFKSLKWEISSPFKNTFPCISAINKDKVVYVANLHIHSKILLSSRLFSDKLWNENIQAANSMKEFPLTMSNRVDRQSDNGNIFGRLIRFIRIQILRYKEMDLSF